MKVLGVDIATHTGMLLLEGDEHRAKSIGPKLKGYCRLQSIAKEFQRTLDLWKPDSIVIEGYAHSRIMGIDTFITIVEVSTLIRMSMYERGLSWIEVTPKTLKKFATGKGNADKDEMATHIYEKWGFKSTNSDIIDAYALARLGQMEPIDLSKLEGVQLVVAGSKVDAAVA
jgi:crossover junction endodeoxyribonuclease RuvC